MPGLPAPLCDGRLRRLIACRWIPSLRCFGLAHSTSRRCAAFARSASDCWPREYPKRARNASGTIPGARGSELEAGGQDGEVVLGMGRIEVIGGELHLPEGEAGQRPELHVERRLVDARALDHQAVAQPLRLPPADLG